MANLLIVNESSMSSATSSTSHVCQLTDVTGADVMYHSSFVSSDILSHHCIAELASVRFVLTFASSFDCAIDHETIDAVIS